MRLIGLVPSTIPIVLLASRLGLRRIRTRVTLWKAVGATLTLSVILPAVWLVWSDVA